MQLDSNMPRNSQKVMLKSYKETKLLSKILRSNNKKYKVLLRRIDQQTLKKNKNGAKV